MNPNHFNKIYEEMANLIGVEDTIKIYEYFKGQQIIFPQRLYNKEYVAKYVREHYNGTNIKELSRKFDYSDRRIRQFLFEKKITEK